MIKERPGGSGGFGW